MGGATAHGAWAVHNLEKPWRTALLNYLSKDVGASAGGGVADQPRAAL